jgi:hypothetical protein
MKFVCFLFVSFLAILAVSKEVCINQEIPFAIFSKTIGKCFKNSFEETLFKQLPSLSTNDAHSEVLFEWLDNLKSLKDQKNTLVHIDSRFKFLFKQIDPDSSLPKPLTLDMIFNDTKPWNKLRSHKDIDISTFIMPMVFGNSFETLNSFKLVLSINSFGFTFLMKDTKRKFQKNVILEVKFQSQTTLE